MAKTIAAIATPTMASSIGVIRISGDDAQKIADKVFKPLNKDKSISNLNGYSAVFGQVENENGVIDECVALNFKAPHSYTGENVVELSLHGGQVVLQQALRAIYDAGAQAAEPGEFTKRAFLNGKMSLTQAEAVMDIISASNVSALQTANAALSGASYKKINQIKEILIYCEAMLAAYTDFPDEGKEEMDNDGFLLKLNEAKEQLGKLIADYDSGAVIKNGVDCVIVGKPNVGKSTLMNLLTKYERSIVTSVAGTTRDIVEETVDIGGCLLKLSDTAGIHSGTDTVEKIGIEKALEKLKTAQLVLAMFSAENELDQDDIDIIKSAKDIPVILVVNKTDIGDYKDIEKLSDYGKIVRISAKTGDGIDNLKQTILELVGVSNINPNDAMLSNERQLKMAKEAYNTVVQAFNDINAGQTLDAVGVLIEDAISNLLSLTGENVTESVVSEVFSKFCVGK